MPEPAKRSRPAKRKQSYAKSRREPPSTSAILLRIAATFFIACVAAGYLVGRASSLKYDDPTSSPALIRRIVDDKSEKAFSDEWIVEKDQDGRLTSFRPAALKVSFSCGAINTRAYDSRTSLVTQSPPKNPRGSPDPRIGFNYLDTLGFLMGGTAPYTATRVAKDAPEAWGIVAAEDVTGKIEFGAAAIALTGMGFGLGYFLGYDARIPCGEPLFQKQLDDKAFWHGVESDVTSDRHWIFDYVPAGKDTSHDFDSWPPFAQPSDKLVRLESGMVRFSPVVRVRLMSWEIPSGQRLREDAKLAHVSNPVLMILRSLSPICPSLRSE